MMTPEERFNLAQFFRAYIEQRLELTIKNAIEQIDAYTITDDNVLNMNLTITLLGSQLKVILSGELDPLTAIKLFGKQTKRTAPAADHNIRLDKEPQ